MSIETLVARQMRWAGRRWPGHRSVRAPSLEENLIIPMEEEVRAQFADGSGQELGTPAVPGKMHSLRSSSALAYNFFAPWRNLDLRPLATALGRAIEGHSIAFERKFRHGLASTPPNMDVAIGGERLLAIESKFGEPYDGVKPPRPLDLKYFPADRERWGELQLPKCQMLASGIGTTWCFRRLDAAQLVKHLLGLAYTTRTPPRLLCLWYHDGTEQGDEHHVELEQFAALLDETVEFSALTYQAAFTALRRGPEPRPGYFDYLAERYFDA